MIEHTIKANRADIFETTNTITNLECFAHAEYVTECFIGRPLRHLIRARKMSNRIPYRIALETSGSHMQNDLPYTSTIALTSPHPLLHIPPPFPPHPQWLAYGRNISMKICKVDSKYRKICRNSPNGLAVCWKHTNRAICTDTWKTIGVGKKTHALA